MEAKTASTGSCFTPMLIIFLLISLYRGPDVYNDFCKEFLSKYAATRPEYSNSMLVELKLQPVEIKPEYVYEIEPPQFEKKEIVESTEVTEAEKQIAARNKDRVCTCGYTRELEEKVEINREGGGVYFKSKVFYTIFKPISALTNFNISQRFFVLF